MLLVCQWSHESRRGGGSMASSEHVVNLCVLRVTAGCPRGVARVRAMHDKAVHVTFERSWNHKNHVCGNVLYPYP